MRLLKVQTGGFNERGYRSNPINCVKPIASTEQSSLFNY